VLDSISSPSPRSRRCRLGLFRRVPFGGPVAAGVLPGDLRPQAYVGPFERWSDDRQRPEHLTSPKVIDRAPMASNRFSPHRHRRRCHMTRRTSVPSAQWPEMQGATPASSTLSMGIFKARLERPGIPGGSGMRLLGASRCLPAWGRRVWHGRDASGRCKLGTNDGRCRAAAEDRWCERAVSSLSGFRSS
jgi:hypothetical protein